MFDNFFTKLKRFLLLFLKISTQYAEKKNEAQKKVTELPDVTVTKISFMAAFSPSGVRNCHTQ